MINETFLIHASEVLGKTDYGFSGSKIVKYFNAKSVEFNVDIPYPKSPFPPDVPNKRTALLENLKCFNPLEQFQMISEICDLEIFEGKDDVVKLKGQLFERYGAYNTTPETYNVELIEETKGLLTNYTASEKQFNSALEKKQKSVYERNLLDDARLALELLLKEILGNEKNLENQMISIAEFQKEKGASKECSNMFHKLVDYYSKYQNNYVKHNDKVNLEEIDFVLELTSSFIKYIINLNNK